MIIPCQFCGIDCERFRVKKATCFDCKMQKLKERTQKKREKEKKETGGVKEWFEKSQKNLHAKQDLQGS